MTTATAEKRGTPGVDVNKAAATGRHDDPAGDGLLVEASGLTKAFGDNVVLRGIDLVVARGDIVSLLGQSGGGKSTLLRCLNLLERPDGGTVRVSGETTYHDGRVQLSGAQLVALRRRVGMVFQQFNLFPHLTAIENIVLPLVQGLGLTKDEAAERAERGLERVGLRGKALCYPETLSGGQQQRVAIARALALRPLLLLFDEPTSSLDPESTAEVLAVMRELGEEGMAMVVATHEIGFALGVSDRAVFIHEGHVVEEGPARQVLTDPQQERTRTFLRRLAVDREQPDPEDELSGTLRVQGETAVDGEHG